MAGTAIDLTAVASGGTAHTLTGATAYYKVEYQIDSGSVTTRNAILSVAAGNTDTAQTAPIADMQKTVRKIAVG